MKHHLLIALLAMLVSALFGPGVAAQEATPPAPVDTGEAGRTNTRVVLPYTPDGINPGLTVTATEEGICGFSSIVALDRPDAWDCLSADNKIYDPCFENPFLAPDEPGEVACLTSPLATDVVVLTLTQPLVREKEVPDGGMSMAQAAGVAIEPWDLPWALELANGDQCELLYGTLTMMAGQVAHYSCANGGIVLGETDRRQPVWTVSYLAEGEVASSLVAVTTAWS